ncbi:MAG: hypothetical protein WCF92_00475 [bacterium]
MLIIKSKIVANLSPWLEKLQVQLGDSFEGFSNINPDAGTAEVLLHPRASKYATQVIEASGFEVVSQAA